MYTGISLQYIQFFEVVNAIKTFRSQWMHFLKREHFKCWTRQYISITMKEQWACVKALGNGNKVWMLAVGYVTH